MLAPLGFVLVLSFGIQRMRAETAMVLFWLYAAVMGLSLGTIFLVFTGESICACVLHHGGDLQRHEPLRLYDKSDLSRFDSFLMMGLNRYRDRVLVNIFVGSSALQFAISIIGVIVFVGLTAYDTQRIKEMYLESDSADIAGKKAMLGALSLYSIS